MGLSVAMVTPWKKRCGIYTYSRDLIDALASIGVDVYVVPLPRFGSKTGEILLSIANKIPLDKIDLVHVQHEYGLYQGMDQTFYGVLEQMGKPIVTTMHAFGSIKIDPFIDKISDVVIVHNAFCKRRLPFPTKIISHGCKQVDSLDKDESKKAVGVDPRVDLVGYVGFISEHKGLETLIGSMIKVPRAGLLVGGGWHTGAETIYIDGLRRFSFEKLPNRCKWMGFVPEDMLATVYSSLDLLVYPSVYATESGALLMALGHGKAVIARRLSPFKEKEAVGALKTFGSIRSLSMNIKRLLKNDDERIALEAGARAYAERNSWDSVAKMHIEEYEKVLEKSKV